MVIENPIYDEDAKKMYSNYGYDHFFKYPTPIVYIA